MSTGGGTLVQNSVCEILDEKEKMSTLSCLTVENSFIKPVSNSHSTFVIVGISCLAIGTSLIYVYSTLR